LCLPNLKNISKNLASDFGSKKQAVFGQASRFFEGDAAHRLKKSDSHGQKLTFFGRNGSG
jgi:hypothetical protein